MPLELHANDNAREGKPSIWLFRGKSVAFLVVSVVVGISPSRILDSVSVDRWLAIPLSLYPSWPDSAVRAFFVNGRLSSNAFDFFLWAAWRLRTRLYLMGVLDRPPI